MARLPTRTSDWAQGIALGRPGVFSTRLVWAAQRILWPLVRVCFRPRMRGADNLPDDTPYLLVANHSAGAGIAEILCFVALYLRQVGAHRPLAGFALPQGFRVFPLSRLLRAIGAVPSTYEAARDTLAKGVPILVFPGGDHETLRPVWQAHRVDFGGRVGFLKIAREAGVPIVPMAIRGSHFTCPIFLRARWLAWVLVAPRLIGLKRWGISLTSVLGVLAIFLLVPLHTGYQCLLAWLWLGSPFVFLPIIPWRITFRIGTPIAPADLFADDGEADLQDVLGRVEGVIAALVADAGHQRTGTDGS